MSFGLVVCWAVNIAWASCVLSIVPQRDSQAEALGLPTSLEAAARLGQISTVPLAEVLGEGGALSSLVSGFIALSVSISFAVMGSGLAHLLRAPCRSPAAG